MTANELPALTGEYADAWLADREVLAHSFVCRIRTCEQRMKRRYRRGTECIQGSLGPDAVALGVFLRGLARLVPSGLVVDVCGQVEVKFVAYCLLAFPHGPTSKFVTYGLALAGGGDGHKVT